MNLDFDENEAIVAETFGDFFAKEAGPAVMRAAEPLGFDGALWERLVSTGAPTMGVATELGGGGARATELVSVAELVGRHLAPVPFVEAATAVNLLAAAGAEELVAEAVEGALTTLALRPPTGGVCRLVPAGAVADVVVLLDGDQLVALRRTSGSRPYLPSPANLGSSPVADVPLTDPDYHRSVLATGADAVRLHAAALASWKLLMAAALEGIRGEALRIGVDYVKGRTAFGVPIGSFQALQHRLADLTVAGDGARLLVYESAWARDTGHPKVNELSAMAFLFETELAFKTCREALQFHGGYGYTLEYDIQLYFRRAKTWPLALGDPRREYQQVARGLFESSEEEVSDGLRAP